MAWSRSLPVSFARLRYVTHRLSTAPAVNGAPLAAFALCFIVRGTKLDEGAGTATAGAT